ncbi:MAG: hydrolase [Gemmatimonadaceae bacterium]
MGPISHTPDNPACRLANLPTLPLQPFQPAWWLPGPHLQTLWPKLLRRATLPPVAVEVWPTPDADEISVVRLTGPSASAPRILVLHGLEGTAQSHYVGGLFAMCRTRRWAADLLLFRTCDGRLNRARRTYHSGEISDPALVLNRIRQDYPSAPLALVGVSLGGNVALRLLAHSGGAAVDQLVAAVAISTPFDLAGSSKHLQRGFPRLYQRHFVRKLKRKALAKLAQQPDLADAARVRQAKTLWEFDDAFTAIVHGFRNAADYYESCSSIGVLNEVQVPTLLLSARDDPFYPRPLLDDVATRAAMNPLLSLAFHESGGHVGFVSGSPLKPTYYAEELVAEFLANHFNKRWTSLPNDEREAHVQRA